MHYGKDMDNVNSTGAESIVVSDISKMPTSLSKSQLKKVKKKEKWLEGKSEKRLDR